MARQKQPHQQTRAEFLRARGIPERKIKIIESHASQIELGVIPGRIVADVGAVASNSVREHRRGIIAALRAGKKVPKRVLRQQTEFPRDLKEFEVRTARRTSMGRRRGL